MADMINRNLTKAGIKVLTKGEAGEQIRYTKIVLGDGELAEGQTIDTLTDVISPKVTLDISEISVETNNTVKITGIFNNSDLNEGFYYREVGLYAEDSEDGEVLYCYGNAGSVAEWIPPTGSATIIEKEVCITTSIGNAQNVVAYIPADAYATRKDYEDLKEICNSAMAIALQAMAVANDSNKISKEARDTVYAMNSQVIANTAKIAVMWNALFAQVAAHPWTITFTKLSDVTVSDGVWNESLARLEC